MCEGYYLELGGDGELVRHVLFVGNRKSDNEFIHSFHGLMSRVSKMNSRRHNGSNEGATYSNRKPRSSSSGSAGCIICLLCPV